MPNLRLGRFVMQRRKRFLTAEPVPHSHLPMHQASESEIRVVVETLSTRPILVALRVPPTAEVNVITITPLTAANHGSRQNQKLRRSNTTPATRRVVAT